jgi:hypothetical protein
MADNQMIQQSKFSNLKIKKFQAPNDLNTQGGN